jgi:ribokinase
MTVIVFGSINMDLVVRSPQLPKAGQTLIGESFTTAAGGKGANQAVACAKLGAVTRMIGCVGDDSFGATLLDGMKTVEVSTSTVSVIQGISTGVALITVDEHGENTIIIVAGANGLLRCDLVYVEPVLDGATVLLLQLEVDLNAVIETAQLARQRGITVILDPAPAQPLPDALYQSIDIITPNESEAEVLVSFPVYDEASANRAAQILLDRGPANVIIKMGSKGAYWANRQGGKFFPAYAVNAIDTVAAGDAFNGSLAAALDEIYHLRRQFNAG